MSKERNDASESAQARIKSLLALGDMKAILEIVSSLEVRADAETTRADAETARADAAVDEADRIGEELREAKQLNEHLRRLVYGRKSEKLTPEDLRQLLLAFESEDGTLPTPQSADERDDDVPQGEADPEPTDERPKPKKRRPNHHGRRPLSPELKRIITAQSLVPEDQRACSHCGDPMCQIRWEEHEKLVHIPAHFVVHVEQREVIACKTKDCPGEAVTAERERTSALPTRVDASVLADLIESKCDDSLPIYRIRDRYARLGADIPLASLYGYWTFGTDLLLALAEVTLGVVLGDDIVALDDTGMPVLRQLEAVADGTKPTEKFRGHLWAFKGNTCKMVAFAFTETWEAAEVQPWILAITGFMQVDDYKGYSTLVPSPEEPGILVKLVPEHRRLGCMMHVRRRFYDAFTLGDKRAAPAVEFIRKLYKVEADAKKRELDADARHALRQEESIPVLAALYKWVDDIKPKLGKTSKLAQAVRYAQNQRPYVERCFTDGRFEIDNGAIERELKKPCVGRRNYLHCGSIDGAKRLAAAYTLVLSAKAVGINVTEYLTDVINKLAGGWDVARIRELVPDAWAAARPTTATAADPARQ
ncbi:MAG TPA: IS66 family transposase [Polyangiaceae bacterium]|nr:IS66 family transposase [Polyangiaceae bacterium]